MQLIVDGRGGADFIDDNEALGIIGTVVSGAWLAGIQRTLSNAITLLGGTLDPALNQDLANVLLSIKALASGNHFKGTVATVAALPSAGNALGDAYAVTADPTPANNVLWICTGLPDTWQEEFSLPNLSGYLLKSGDTMTGLLTLATGGGAGLLNLLDALTASGEAYDSGWFAVSGNNNYVKSHGLAAAPRVCIVLIANSATPAQWEVGVAYYQGAQWMGQRVISIGATTLTLEVYTYVDDTKGNLGAVGSGYARVIAIK